MKYHNNIDALVWLDTSAEQCALYHQAFALAKMQVEEVLKDKTTPTSLCVFTDCDETLLDNSEYNSWLVLTGRNFTNVTWDEYCKAKRSRACSGAVEFTLWLKSKGVQLYYVTSRSNRTRAETCENMKNLGFPVQPNDASDDITKSHLFMADMKNPNLETDQKWSKYDQYNWIQKHRQVSGILWLGDNLSDFAPNYKDDPWDKRLKQADVTDKNSWGKKYIVMPNPVYGNWLFNYKSKNAGQVLVDDEAAKYNRYPMVVREPILPHEAPKLSELEAWPNF